jgi:SNF2 family DNA or RNA helicase
LIVVPKSTLNNWDREVAKWVPGFNTIVLQGAKEDRVSVTGIQAPSASLAIDRDIAFTTGRDDQGAYHDVRL